MINFQRSSFVIGLLLCCAAAFASTDERNPPLSQEPNPRGDARHYTDYKPQPRERVRNEVRRVASNGSFVSRCLLVITCDGADKNFETITGQDGLTFGITDFATNSGVYDFMKLLNQRAPQEFKAAFGEHTTELLDFNWIKDNNGGGSGKDANDAGLVRFEWLRRGLDEILCNRRLYGLQLENFKQGKINPSLAEFKKNSFELEFTLASMIGVANSAGPGGMRTFLAEAKKSVPQDAPDREVAIAKRMLFLYAAKDPSPKRGDAAYLNSDFVGNPAAELGHRADRAHRLVMNFPPEKKQPFTDLGNFALETNERSDAATVSATPSLAASKKTEDQATATSASALEPTASPTPADLEPREANEDVTASPTPSTAPASPPKSAPALADTATPVESATSTPTPSPQPMAAKAIESEQAFHDKFPATKSTRKWLELVRSVDVEKDVTCTFPELAGKTSCMLKIDKNGKTLGSFLPLNSSGNPNTEIAYFNMARILGFEDIIRPAAPFKIGDRAELAFKDLLEKEPSKSKARDDNRRSILERIQNKPHEMRGALKHKKPNGIKEYDAIGKNEPNMDDVLMQLVLADQPMPAADATVTILKKYKANALEVGRALANLMTLDAIFAQNDRFSGGNFTVNTDENGTFAIFSTDNGGAELDQASANKSISWFSRYDPTTIARLKQLSAFLKGKQAEFSGYTDAQTFVVDLGLYLDHSPAQYVKQLSRNCELLLAAANKNAATYGQANTFFPSNK